jgi:GGDEF domain-containing protein
MSIKGKAITVGAVLLAVCMFLYFTVRFKYVERDYITTLIGTTNSILREYHSTRMRPPHGRKLSADDLSDFLKSAHKKHANVALLAVTDSSLSIRLSSKNDRYIRSASLFEAILKDFTQEKFNISRNKPYTVRYYDDRSGGKVEQLKFYIFINRIEGYRLLVAYPHAFDRKMLARTGLELALLTVFIVLISTALYVAMSKKTVRDDLPRSYILDLNPGERPAVRGERTVSRETSNVASDALSGYIHSLFKKINTTYNTDALSLYIFHSSGRLVKTMEYKGRIFLKIDSASFDTIDIDNEAGRELRSGATLVLDDGRKMVIPLKYRDSFLGTVSIHRRTGFEGSEVRDIKSSIKGILKNIHDYITVNDVMTDTDTGLHSKIYFNLKYMECMKSWNYKGKDFSVIVLMLFNKIEQIGMNEKNNIIKLVLPAISDIIKNEGFICRYDEYLAILLNESNARRAKRVAREIRNSLMKYRIRINPESVVQIAPSIGISSTDTAAAGRDEDLVTRAIGQIQMAV